MILDLNCDLGEGESKAITRALFQQVTSANIACGGHAGDLSTMEFCLQLCKKFSVQAGAHPGHNDAQNFGRIPHPIAPKELQTLLLQQIAALQYLGKKAGVTLHHVKLHGALYHQVENEAALRKAYLSVMAEHWPDLIIYALAGGKVIQEAKKYGLMIWGEAFGDRNYLPDGNLIPRNDPQALVKSPDEMLERVKSLEEAQGIPLPKGGFLKIEAQTICVHSDSPTALAGLKKIRKYLEQKSAA